VARDATMSVWGVPFFYTPVYDVPVERRTPERLPLSLFRTYRQAGYQFRMPYYFNLAPNYDATLDPRYYTLRGAMLSGEVRYLFPRSNGIFEFDFLPSDNYNDQKITPTASDTQGMERYSYKFINNTIVWPGWSLNTNINRASDQNYLHDFGDDLYSVSTTLLYSIR
jgi:LPS-assembly protein